MEMSIPPLTKVRGFLDIRIYEKDNLYDKNAVSVSTKKGDEMLGHVSRELAPKYVSLVNIKGIKSANVTSVESMNGHLKIFFKVEYDKLESDIKEKTSSKLWGSASLMPEKPGVYGIRNNKNGRLYIGSSKNLKKRAKEHVSRLFDNSHHNTPLQFDFDLIGSDSFEFIVIKQPLSVSNLEIIESSYIQNLLKSGKNLYNQTIDGKGRGYKSSREKFNVGFGRFIEKLQEP